MRTMSISSPPQPGEKRMTDPFWYQHCPHAGPHTIPTPKQSSKVLHLATPTNRVLITPLRGPLIGPPIGPK